MIHENTWSQNLFFSLLYQKKIIFVFSSSAFMSTIWDFCSASFLLIFCFTTVSYPGISTRGLSCTWTCLHYTSLWSIWLCLRHRGLSCTWTCLPCLDNRNLCCSWTYLHYRGLWCGLTCLHFRGLCCFSSCLHHSTGSWAAPGRVWTTVPCAAPNEVSTPQGDQSCR